MCVGVFLSGQALQEEWKTLDASVLEATEALGEKKEKAMKAQEKKEEEKSHRESVPTVALFFVLVLHCVKVQDVWRVNLSFGQKIPLCGEGRP